MTIYVDALMHNGWPTHCPMESGHMFSNTEDHNQLNTIAQAIDLKHGWLQSDSRMSDDPLTPRRHTHAITDGAVPVHRSRAMWIGRAQRAQVGAEYCS